MTLEEDIIDLHKTLVQSALSAGGKEIIVTMTFGELFLFQTLMQDAGPIYLSNEQLLELMERNANRIKAIKEVVDETKDSNGTGGT